MTVTYIPTIGRKENNAVTAGLVKQIRADKIYPTDESIILYAGWPQLKDYNGRTHTSDLTIVSDNYGVKLLKIYVSSDKAEAKKEALSILQSAATTESLLGKSLNLKKRRKLVFDVVPILYAPNLGGAELEIDDVELALNENDLRRILLDDGGQVSPDQKGEIQAIIEGAKALGQMVEAESSDEISPIARAYHDLEATIYNFDTTQRSVALTSIDGPQRIRGLAGTGKTVILAMKAALAHIENPSSKILVTYYTRSLRDVIERLITRF